jgi:hypothetical protein
MESENTQFVTKNVAEHSDCEVFLLSLGKFRILHRKSDEEYSVPRFLQVNVESIRQDEVDQFLALPPQPES